MISHRQRSDFHHIKLNKISLIMVFKKIKRKSQPIGPTKTISVKISSESTPNEKMVK